MIRFETEGGPILEVDNENIRRIPGFILHRQCQILDALKRLAPDKVPTFIQAYLSANGVIQNIINDPRTAIIVDPFMEEPYYRHTFALHFARLCSGQPKLNREMAIRQAQIDAIGTIMLVDVRTEIVEPGIPQISNFRYTFRKISAIVNEEYPSSTPNTMLRIIKYTQVYCHFIKKVTMYTLRDSVSERMLLQTAEVLANRYIKAIQEIHEYSPFQYELSPDQLGQRSRLFSTPFHPELFMQSFNEIMRNPRLELLREVMRSNIFEVYTTIVIQLREMIELSGEYNPMRNEADYIIHFRALYLTLNHMLNRPIPLLVPQSEDIIDDMLDYRVYHQVSNAIQATLMAAQHIFNTYLPQAHIYFITPEEYKRLYIALHFCFAEFYLRQRSGEGYVSLKSQVDYLQRLVPDDRLAQLNIFVGRALQDVRSYGVGFINEIRVLLQMHGNLNLDTFVYGFSQRITHQARNIIRSILHVLVDFEMHNANFGQSEWTIYVHTQRPIIGIMPQNFVSNLQSALEGQLMHGPIALPPIAQHAVLVAIDEQDDDELSSPLMFSPEIRCEVDINDLMGEQLAVEHSDTLSTDSDEPLRPMPL
jgi:hypothetical protein